jgi:hypothetical protein
MPKILLGVSVVLMAVSAVFGFMTKTKSAERVAEVQKYKTQAEAAAQDLVKANDKVKVAEESAAVAKAKAEQSDSQLTTAKADATKAQSDVTDLKSQIATKDTKIAELEAKVANTPSTTTTTTPSTEVTEIQAKLTEAETKLKEAEQVNQSLATKVREAEAKVQPLEMEKKRREGQIMARGLEGTVLAVNQAWSFVVLSIGDKQGVLSNAEMIVKRGGEMIARVKVTSVEPSTAIADIVPGSLGRGVRVQPGDKVVYPGA